MVHYSIIIPQRDCGEPLRRQVPRLRAVLQRLSLPYEILCVDDGSSQPTLDALNELQSAEPALRMLRLAEPAGTSTALSAGIAAARGEILIAIEAGDHYSVDQVPHLVARLSRLDLVVGRLRLGPWRKFWHRVGRIPRWMLLGIEVRHPDCLFWAARREAVEGIHLARGMRRYLPWLVARRGFRVGDMYVNENPSRIRLNDPRANPLDLLTAWWTCRRWRNDTAHEIQPTAENQTLNAIRSGHG
jgi:glycosyltransferase involved in cell wall biosynthesis